MDNYIEPNQYTSFTGDGVYAKTDVGPLLDQHYQRKGFYLWDLMHLSAVQDNAMRNENKEWSKQFKWLHDMTITIRKAVTFVQWGMEWSHFFQADQTSHLSTFTIKSVYLFIFHEHEEGINKL